MRLPSVVPALLAAAFVVSPALCGELSPNLKVFLCTGDFGMWAQDRVPMITGAVAKAAPNVGVAWQSQQSYNMTRLLESAAFVRRSDVTWDSRKESEAGVASGCAKVQLDLAPYQAAALTWTRK